MAVKIANKDDFNIIEKLALEFADNSVYKGLLDPEKIRDNIKRVLNNSVEEGVIILYDDKGFIAGVVTEILFGLDRVATELAWWVTPSERNTKVGTDLLKAFEAWAKIIGCRFVSVNCLSDLDLNDFYTKMGFSLYEKAYLKKID